MTKSKDKSWFVIISILILVFSSIPTWTGYASETANLSFKGIFFDPQDYAVHLSMIRAGMQGDLAYQFRFTTEPHVAGYSRIFYTALGQANRPINLAPAAWFEIARLLFGALALYSLYELSVRVFEDAVRRRIAFLLAVFGSGLGWLQIIAGLNPGSITPIDFWFIDAYFFFGLSLFPHFSFVTAMMCLSFAFYLDFLQSADWKRIATIALFSILVEFANPIAFVLADVVFVAATVVVWVREKKISLKHLLALAVLASVQLPLLLYNYLLLAKDPIWSQLTRQNLTLSPPFAYYLWGFGLLLVFAAIGTYFSFQRKHPALIASATWVTAGLLLAYAPFYIQRRFLHAVSVPLGMLAAQGLTTLLDIASSKFSFIVRRVPSLSLLMVLLLSISSIALGIGSSLYVHSHPSELYYPASLESAFDWLQENASPNDFVLSAAPTGLLIAQNTDMRVYIGHEMATLNYESKVPLVEAFFRGQAVPGWLEETNVQWIFYGPYERLLTRTSQFLPTNLEIVYKTKDVIIYKITP